MLRSPPACPDAPVKFVAVSDDGVAEVLPLPAGPEVLGGIELGSIGREVFHRQPRSLRLQIFSDQPCFVHPQVINDQDQFPALDLALHLFQEGNEPVGINRPFNHLKVQARV